MLSQADTFRVRIQIAKLKINFRSVIIFMIFLTPYVIWIQRPSPYCGR